MAVNAVGGAMHHPSFHEAKDPENDVINLTELPEGVLSLIVTHLSAHDIAKTMGVSRALRDAVAVALSARRVWSSCDHHGVSHMKASRLFKFLARHSPQLTGISCCFAADRLYGGSLLESSLGALVAATRHLTHLTLLNVDVTDTVLQHLGKHCSALQHLAIGRTENNAFGNFVSDDGLAMLAQCCQQLDSISLFRCYSCSDGGLWALARHGRHIRNLVLHSCPQVTAPGLIRFIEASPQLQLLDVLLPESGPGGAAVNFETCFALAANCTQLHVLRLSEELLSGGVLDDECLIVVARGCTRLQELELVQVEVSDTFMAVLAAHCTQLTSLRLEQTYVGGSGVEQLLTAAPNLAQLRVAGCSTHSWMLPAEYMFAGLSVADLRHIVHRRAGVGSQLTTLDLSCLALEPAEVAEAHATAAAEAQTAANASGAGMTNSSSSSSSLNDAANLHAPALLELEASDEQSQRQLVTSERTADLKLIPTAWCQQLVSLSLDWLKVDGLALQECLMQTLSCCSSLSRLSLIGYQGNVDQLLAATGNGVCSAVAPLSCSNTDEELRQEQLNNAAAAATKAMASSSCGTKGTASQPSSCSGRLIPVVPVPGAGAKLKQLNLQHSMVTDAGLLVAVEAFPGLSSLKLGYCRHIGDPGLSYVSQMKQLEELDLYNTPCVSTAAVTRLAKTSLSLMRLYIGHNTSALNRSPAASTAMGYINGSSPNTSRYCSSSGGSSTSSVWSAVSQAAAARGGAARLAVLSRNPASESEFEKRSLQALLGACSGVNC